MNVDQHYKVIISDRARRILASHIRFMTKVNKDVAKDMKKIMDAMRSLNQMPQRFISLMNLILHQINIVKYLLKNGILFFIKSKMIKFTLTIS